MNIEEITIIFLSAYLIIALILSVMVLVINYRKLKSFKWWQLCLLFGLLPLLGLRELFKKRINYE